MGLLRRGEGLNDMATLTSAQNRKLWGSKQIVARYKTLGLSALLVLFTILILVGYLSPFGYMSVTSIKLSLIHI